MNYGDQIKLEAVDGDDRKVFVVKRSAGATSSGYKLYGYDPNENGLNFLEDYGLDGHNPPVVADAERRIRQYLGDDYTVRVID